MSQPTASSLSHGSERKRTWTKVRACEWSVNEVLQTLEDSLATRAGTFESNIVFQLDRPIEATAWLVPAAAGSEPGTIRIELRPKKQQLTWEEFRGRDRVLDHLTLPAGLWRLENRYHSNWHFVTSNRRAQVPYWHYWLEREPGPGHGRLEVTRDEVRLANQLGEIKELNSVGNALALFQAIADAVPDGISRLEYQECEYHECEPSDPWVTLYSHTFCRRPRSRRRSAKPRA